MSIFNFYNFNVSFPFKGCHSIPIIRLQILKDTIQLIRYKFCTCTVHIIIGGHVSLSVSIVNKRDGFNVGKKNINDEKIANFKSLQNYLLYGTCTL